MVRLVKSVNWGWVYVSACLVAALAVGWLALTRDFTPPPASETVARYTPAPGPSLEVINVALFGDSIAHGSGASDIKLGWASRLQRHEAWNMTSLARGGTGFVSSVERAAAAQESCRRDRCPNFSQMMEELNGAEPDVLLVSGGRNDVTVSTAREAEAIQDFFRDLRSSFPSAKVLATNVLWDDSPRPENVEVLSATIEAAVRSVGGTYVNIGQPLERRPDLIASDGTHPNDQGHEIIFNLVLDQLKESGILRQF